VADLLDLAGSFNIATGNLVTDSAQLENLLVEGVRRFNAAAPREFELTGTTFDREPTDLEAAILVVEATLAFIDGESLKYSLNAVVVSNAAGRTDLTGIELGLAKRRKEIIDNYLTPLLNRLKGGAFGVFADIAGTELGETLPFAIGAPYSVVLLLPGWPGVVA
jgi:hypothetical protein